MSGRWAGKVAVVTGGASGIGRALVRELAAEGAVVVAADLDASGAQATAQTATLDARSSGGRAFAEPLDVTRGDDVQALADRVKAAHGRIDLWVNNAGVGVVGEVQHLPLSAWRKVLDVNLMGVVHGVAAAYPIMIAQKAGTIVNVASIMGLTPGPMLAPYTASKHAVVGLTKALRLEAHGLGVTVVCACPGFVDTPIHAASPTHGGPAGDLSGGLKAATAAEVATGILRGAARGDAMVLVPGHAKAIAWIMKWAPGLAEAMSLKRVAAARQARQKS